MLQEALTSYVDKFSIMRDGVQMFVAGYEKKGLIPCKEERT